ncbi:MAG TPA: S8 family serine peptidase, partial [Isosphaeraceae bacterium]|nr:S8 family serine peptidase [Isosphaeraceae bacterium]
MSHPSRPRARGPAKRPRAFKTEIPLLLEDRCLLTPYLPSAVVTPTATFTAATSPTTNADLGTVTVTTTATSSAVTTLTSQAPITSVTELTPLSSFGGDIVRVKAGPGGVFGNGLYAISRGGGSNTAAVNRPGVIYRIDTATGKASVFFDLNTVMNQIDPNALVRDGVNPAANSLGGATPSAPNDPTGFKNWYDIAFDPEGNFNGQPTMFVSTVDRLDPAKNAIYMISPSGQFLGAFVLMTDGLAATKFNISPTGMVVPGPQDQAFLRGLLAGSGESTTNGTFAALFFNANQYSPGQTLSNGTLPKGVSQTGMTLGTIVGMTEANAEYTSPVYSAFTDFGTPAIGGIPGTPGSSGIQGSNGELQIGLLAASTTGTSLTLDQQGAVSTQLRRLQDISFDQYGYFSQSVPLTSSTTSTTTSSGSSTSTTTVSVTIPPNYGGSLFATDLASGLTDTVTLSSVAEGDIPAGVSVTGTIPVEGTTIVGLQKTNPSAPYNATTNPLVLVYTLVSADPLLGGRVIRVTPQGVVDTFAQGFDVATQSDASSFYDSSLTLTFSADGTSLWVSDNDAIWQFKTTASLAGSTSGTLIGLNDLRTLSVPYDGQNSAVAVVDTGVDGKVPAFRGRVSTGKNIWTGAPGNQDLASGPTSSTSGTGTSGTSGNILGNTFDGHGTPVAGVVAQFVPQATIEPVAIFAPFFGSVSLSSSSTSSSSSSSSTSSSSSLSATSNALTSANAVYQGMAYVAANPFVDDPVRPGRQDRVIASTFAFGTQNTFQSEADAYKNYPQIVIALKNQLHKFRKLGIAPIAAAGQFGAPLGSSSSSSSTTSTSGTTTTGGGFNNANNSSLGDVNGMSLPAVLNEVISVTGTYPFPFTQSASTTPNDPPIGVIPNLEGPVLVFGNALTIGGTAASSSGFTGNSGGATTNVSANVTAITAADLLQYNDRILGAVNRSVTTDFAAPAIDVPTFRRRFSLTTTSGGTSTNSSGAGDPANHLTFSQVGTSMSSAIVTGAYAMVASALDYWISLNQSSGVTSDAYLTTPVGVNTLSFGTHAFKDLSAYNNPDGINGILAYTAVPAADVNDSGSLSTPPLINTTDRQHHFPGSTSPPNYARISIGNAIASIEGTIAINYLLAHNDFPLIDTNHDGLITAQEIQNFTDTAATKGLAEAGAMARLLGGTDTYAQPEPELNNVTFNENPDQPAALQRRFNYF